jgi:hypothetical protein
MASCCKMAVPKTPAAKTRPQLRAAVARVAKMGEVAARARRQSSQPKAAAMKSCTAQLNLVFQEGPRRFRPEPFFCSSSAAVPAAIAGRHPLTCKRKMMPL